MGADRAETSINVNKISVIASKAGFNQVNLRAKESARLISEQRQINRMEDRLRESGDGLTKKEHIRLAHQQNQANRHIYKQKHDEQDRP